jgi:hypothetical protein
MDPGSDHSTIDEQDQSAIKPNSTVILETDTAVSARETPAPREVSAATIGRMMGLATSTELKLLEGKIDLLSTRMGNVGAKLERLGNLVQNAPTGSDLERIDVQIGALRTMLREAVEGLSKHSLEAPTAPSAEAASNAAARSSRIISSSAEES